MQLTPRFEEALVYAAQLHSKQARKGTGVPYISHLLAVCGLALENGGSEDEAIAALLHDAVEDQGGQATLEVIRQKFGDNVAEIVLGCSDTDVIPKPPWRERKERYLQHLKTDSTHSVRLVSLCDKLHNARTTLADYRERGNAIWAVFRGGQEGILWYFRSMVEIFHSFGDLPPALTDEFERVVTELEQSRPQT